MDFEITMYCLPNGKAPVKEFIDSLKISAYRKFVYKKELLVRYGPWLSMPHAKYLGKGLSELRFTTEEGDARIIYFLINNKMVLVHAFMKTTQKTPKNALELAYKRMKDYKERK